ncbi:3-oxoacyl-[acyl-carrier-protein] synthase III C-terminal domain-containing protein [Streptomyces sp. NBC_01615]|uniref:3-oxoacyl-[acyl-carrier-protein] synthase III C-terminal domain-containing protein n=1 Tax=Streptomyces sp. NBC_01615 TaxID=2975898 RepID=UPI003865CF7E
MDVRLARQCVWVVIHASWLRIPWPLWSLAVRQLPLACRQASPLPQELGLVCVHQPSVPFVRTFCERLGIRTDAIVPTFHRTGNMGAATLPLQLAFATEEGRLRRGMQAALFCMASGASAGVMLINW